jgi:hypothetical protein
MVKKRKHELTQEDAIKHTKQADEEEYKDEVIESLDGESADERAKDKEGKNKGLHKKGFGKGVKMSDKMMRLHKKMSMRKAISSGKVY